MATLKKVNSVYPIRQTEIKNKKKWELNGNMLSKIIIRNIFKVLRFEDLHISTLSSIFVEIEWKSSHLSAESAWRKEWTLSGVDFIDLYKFSCRKYYSIK